MFFKLGQEVVLKFTGDKGKITEIHSDGMVVVYVAADDMYIPVYEEDLVLPTEFKGVENDPKTVKVKPTDAELFPVQTQYNIITSLGFQLAFEEVRKHEDIEKYKIYLINDTDDEAIFVFKLKIKILFCFLRFFLIKILFFLKFKKITLITEKIICKLKVIIYICRWKVKPKLNGSCVIENLSVLFSTKDDNFPFAHAAPVFTSDIWRILFYYSKLFGLVSRWLFF